MSYEMKIVNYYLIIFLVKTIYAISKPIICTVIVGTYPKRKCVCFGCAIFWFGTAIQPACPLRSGTCY